MTGTCYRDEPGCGYNDGQEIVNGASVAATRSCRFANPFEGEGTASWTSEDHGVAGNVNQIDDAASGVGMDFARVIVHDSDPQAGG